MSSVAAIIPTYNRVQTVSRSIESVLQQTRPLDEIVVVDDGSTDETQASLAARYGSSIRYIRTANRGVSAARMTGVEAARTAWIAFLDSDDEWMPEKTKRQMQLAEKSNDVLIFGDVEIVWAGGRREERLASRGLSRTTATRYEHPLNLCLPLMQPHFNASLIRRDAIMASDALRKGFRVGEDLLLMIDLALMGSFVATDDVVARWYRTEDLMSSSVSASLAMTPEYFRARMAAYERLVLAEGCKRWAGRYESMVRGLCNCIAGQSLGNQWRAAMKHFQFRVTPTGVGLLARTLTRGLWAEIVRGGRRS
jgi:glycosyltransferase involved in cell wall biosynthesis